MTSMWKGQNLFVMIFMISAYPIMFMFLMLPSKYLMYEITGTACYLVMLIVVRYKVMLDKRTMIDGVLWLDSWTIRDLDYSEELLWGVEAHKLMEFELGAGKRPLEDYFERAQELLEIYESEEKKVAEDIDDESRAGQKKRPKLNDAEKKVIEMAKRKTKEEMRGSYFYLVKLSQDVAFEDTKKHTFNRALFVTQFPWEIEFNPDRLRLEVDGYFADGRAAKCALDIEAWITDDRPLVTIAWTEASTLEIKARLQKQISIENKRAQKAKRLITALRNLIDHYEAKTERLQLTEQKWKKRADGFQDLYEESEQWWEVVHDDYFNANAMKRDKSFRVGRRSGIALALIFIILLGLLIGFFMGG